MINCLHCANNSSLGNITCFRRILDKIRENKDVDSIIFQRGYKKILNPSSFKTLREYVDVIDSIEDEEEMCDADFEAFSILKFKMQEDPVGAILHLMNIEPCKDDKKVFDSIKKKFEKTEIWKLVNENKSKYKENELFHIIFRDRILPGFVSFYTEAIPRDAKIIEKYEIAGSSVQIYEMNEKPHPVYHITPKELNLGRNELILLNKAFMRLSKEEFDQKRGQAICEKVITELSPEISEEKKKELAAALRRYSFGYGIIEVLFQDPRIQDVFVDSPGDKQIYINHADYAECATNIILSAEELEKLSTRFRLISGRPFDESYPILHAELKDMGIRIAGVTEPMTFNGIGFAFRKHSVQPWTMQQFIKNGTVSAEAAGLISFLVDGQQSILVTGSRGSGKTSILSSLFAEIPQNFRIITIEDTPELPIEELRDLGYNIQHLRVKSSLQREAYEVTAEEALRSALRLGESVLVIGEVRGEEAKSLFEAMRIGAAGNVVMGTIHGSSAYDVWDRIVNDLKVPSTSFKAADIVINCAPVRKGEKIKRERRIIGITEIGKFWNADPQKEKGFVDLMVYNRSRDRLEVSKDLRKSYALKTIAMKKGMSMADVMKSIKTRAKIKEAIVKASNKNNNLLDVKFALMSTNKFIEIMKGFRTKPSYPKVLRDFRKWLAVQQKTFKG
ncbi:MAG: type II/IV secretion system ATPase subunit [Candidatus Nanoarchaeia archaeon]|nr:type II/IV secretion system ATPase subunit [Candidatus Nanoarchaeia archaeon]